MSVRRRLATTLAWAALAAPALAHDGPPYLFVDAVPFDGRTLTIYADPDVGTGTFYLYFDEADDLRGLDLALSAWPADGRLEPVTVPVERAEGMPYQRIAAFEFDRRGPWMLRLFEPGAGGAGGAPRAELTREVDVTPPGSLGPIDVLWYLSPFATIAVFWTMGMRRRRRMLEQQESPPETPR